MSRRKPGIRQRDIRMAGQVMTDLARAAKDANHSLRQDALEGSHEIARITRLRVNTQIDVTTRHENRDGDDVERDTAVSIEQEIELPSPPTSQLFAPFDLVHGVLGVAEANRERVEYALSDEVGLPKHPAIFATGENSYWVPSSNGEHRLVEFTEDQSLVTLVKSIAELNEAISGMLQYIERAAIDIYGE